MCEDKDLRVIVSKWDDSEIYIIAADNVKKVYLHDCYDQYGQKIDEDEAGDYSLKNRSCDMQADMLQKGKEIFGKTFEDVELDNSLEIENAEELGLKDREEEINAFIKQYEEDEATYIECEAIQYWDGQNNRSAIIGGVEEGADYEYAGKELENEILKEFSNIESPEYNAGVAKVKGEKYSFMFSQYANKNFCICEVTEGSKDDEE